MVDLVNCILRICVRVVCWYKMEWLGEIEGVYILPNTLNLAQLGGRLAKVARSSRVGVATDRM